MSTKVQELDAFVRESLAHGEARGDVEHVLLEAGWTTDQVRGALDAYADVPFAVPVPRPRPSTSAGETFRYLLMFTTLYLSAYHLGCLCFEFINRAFPDPADRFSIWGRPDEAIRWSAASLAIAFPLFLLVSRAIHGEIARDPVKRLSPVRRWLTYLTLFIAACIIIGDVTTLVYNALGGELTARFLLKVLTVGGISGTILGYFLHSARIASGSVPRITVPGDRALALAASAAVLGALVGAFAVLDPPGVQRQRRMDEHRVNDLVKLKAATETYWSQHKKLPPDLESLGREPGLVVPRKDPETGAPYVYEVTGEFSYRLCADFARDSSEQESMLGYATVWVHGAGRHCFEQTIPKSTRDSWNPPRVVRPSTPE
jgi:hypothetical protein